MDSSLPAGVRRSRLFFRKPLAALLEEARGENRLRRILGPVHLTALGIGAVIGAGIFVATGAAARNVAGPALMLSYAVAAVTCVFAALCYAEFAAMVPVAGSAYTYAYATLGELFAWIIGWDLILEYGVASAAVATGWSAYAQGLLAKAGLVLPAALVSSPWRYDPAAGSLVGTGALVNLPAALVVGAVTYVLVRGIQETSRLNTVMVAVKVAAVLFVIAAGLFFVSSANWRPFAPYGWTGLCFFGHTVAGQVDPGGKPVGMLAGAAIIFFAYIGFDAVSTHTEEARNPQRDVPVGIVTSLAVCSILYVAMVAVLTGMVRFDQLDISAPVSLAFKARGQGWAEGLVAVAGVAGITSVLLVMMLSGPRVFLAMARDGLLPRKVFGVVHPRYRTPWKSTILTGACVAVMAGLLPIDVLLHLTNIGTLLAFVIVCSAVLIMRRTHPGAERPFRCPWVPAVPILGILSCLLLMFSLPVANWYRLGIWLALGILVYFGYGRRHSVLGRASGADPA
ncbi:amino acid permease [Mesoterricola silvestris]|uniref:Amino acid permease n=1 Tax=Mesoterricola silvestris TaxID=2927979 RepID=A0AA48KBE9_9BACT|nr:amino acid permease [Mesoterricola silvestris]BDU72458.1 amino acid permease [Mesoterricola silvestris]